MNNTKQIYSTNKNLLKEIRVKSHENIKTELKDNKIDNKSQNNSGKNYYNYFK
jgi:hypothetical protein